MSKVNKMSILPQFIIIFLLIFYSNNADNGVQTENELWETARKSLAQRTREYVKNHPISEDLRSFIDEINQSKRKKRQGNMYAIKDGDVVPLEQLEEQFNTDSNLGPGFTVVPLLIPIPLQNTVTLKNKDLLQSTVASNDDGATWRVKGNKNKYDDDKQEVVENLVEDKLKSTSSSSVDLNKVLADVEDLITAQKKSNSKEGALCNVSGFWNSQAGGVRFHIKKLPDTVKVTMRPTEPPTEDGFIKSSWNVTAQVPFAQAAQVIIRLTAHKGKKVALFLGECRVCDGSETITGDWLVSRISNNCKDQKAAHSFISDVLRKDNIEILKNAHQRMLSTATTGTSLASTEQDDNF